MTRMRHWIQLVAFSSVLFTGACLPDNVWADVWGYSIVTGTIEAVRDVILGTVLPS